MMKIKIKAEELRLTTSDIGLAIAVLDKIRRGEAFQTPITPADNIIHSDWNLANPKKRKSFKIKMRNPWTIEEEAVLLKSRHLTPQEVMKDEFLRKRHTKQAIRTRFSKVMTSNPMIEPEKPAIKSKKPKSRGKWTSRELSFINANLDKTPKFLMAGLSGKSRSAIENKKYNLKKAIK